MIGRQIFNPLSQFLTAMNCNCAKMCCGCHKDDKRDQWEIDKELKDFNSSTLSNEYFELGN